MNTNKYRILFIEDENNIRNFVKTVLEANDYQVLTSTSCQQGIMMVSSHVPDMIILDLGLPDMDGLELIRRVRRSSAVPILVLSARTLEADKVAALDLGANDYVTKPFGTAELLARVRAALRNGRTGIIPGEKFVLQDLVIDYDRRQVTVDGTEIKLMPYGSYSAGWVILEAEAPIVFEEVSHISMADGTIIQMPETE